MSETTPSLGLSNKLGLWLGFTAWLIMPLWLVVDTGDLDLLYGVLLPGAAATIGLATFCHLMLLGVIALHPGNQNVRTTAVLGSMCLAIGVLYLLAVGSFLPVIEKSEAGRELLDLTGSPGSDAPTLPAVLALIAGAGGLGYVLRKPGEPRKP